MFSDDKSYSEKEPVFFDLLNQFLGVHAIFFMFFTTYIFDDILILSELR
jgi:hypothetical protein